jgi:hypothetical protein
MSEEPEIVALGAAFAGPQANDDTQEKQPLHAKKTTRIAFNRMELATILNLYGSKVAAGEWRDYAMDFSRERAVFAVFHRSSEQPLYRIEKNPKLARKQGAYSVTAPGGLILRRGHDLGQVLKVLLKKPKLISA